MELDDMKITFFEHWFDHHFELIAFISGFLSTLCPINPINIETDLFINPFLHH